ncbi:MAG: hypothetical protein J1F60_11150 [Oscillospiraceae bacterium]|nr:hypothetical protein [Oscillospiraceae bacterium]
MAWNQAAVTDKGLELLAEAVEKGGITITRAAGGETCCAASELTAQTEVSAPARHIDIARKERSGSVITVNLRISNTGAAQAFTVRQIGLYAAANGGEEVLLALIQDERGEEIPSEAENPEYLLELDLAIPVSNADKIDVDMSGGVFTTPDDVERMIDDYFSSSFQLPVRKELNEMTWKDIETVAQFGLAPVYWSIGDTKTLDKIDGKIGDVSFKAQNLQAYILGFNHNGADRTIDFGTFKHPSITNGNGVAIYANTTVVFTDGSLKFNMNHWGSSSTNNNFGAWEGCDLRYDILGSTNIPPSDYGKTHTAANVGYDPVDYDIANNPVPNTLMACLPKELRAVMKPMTIWTDNKGGHSSNSPGKSDDVTASIDFLPLLALHEVIGKTGEGTVNANGAENVSRCPQYAYYKLGNSVQKHSCGIDGTVNNTSATIWWLRSVNTISDSLFICINGTTVTNYTSAYSLALAPIFRV